MCIQKIQCSYEQKVSVLCRHSFGSSHNISSPMNVGEERLCDESKEHLQKRLAKGPNVFLFWFCNSTSSMTAAWQKEQVSRWAGKLLEKIQITAGGLFYVFARCMFTVEMQLSTEASFNSSTVLVQSQLVCLLPVGILYLLFTYFGLLQ